MSFSGYIPSYRRERSLPPRIPHEFDDSYRSPRDYAGHHSTRSTNQRFPINSVYLQMLLEKERLEEENRRLKNRLDMVEEKLREKERELRYLELTKSYEENYRALSAGNFITQNDVDRIRRRYHRSLEESSNLEKKLQRKESEVWNLRRKLMDTESHMMSVKELLRKRELDVQKMNREIQRAQIENNTFATRLHEREKEYADLMESFVALKDQNRSLREKECSIRFANDKKTQEIEKWREQYYWNLEQRRKIEEDYRRVCQKCEILRLEKDLISTKLANVEEENKQLHKERENQKILEKRNARYQRMSQSNEPVDTQWIKRFTEMENELHTLRKKNRSLEEENGTLRKTAKDLQRELTTVKKLYKDLEEENSRLRRLYPNLQMDTRENDVENLKRELSTVMKRNKDLEEEHRRLLQEKNDMKLMHSNAINRKEDEILETKRSLEDKDREIKSLQSKLIDVKKAQMELPKTSEYQRLYEESEKLKKENANLEKLLEDCMKSFEEIEKKQKESRKNASSVQLENENKQLKDELAKMKKEAEYPRYVQQESKDSEKLRAELRNISTENQTCRQQISILQEEKASAMAKYNRAESEVSDIQAEVRQKQLEIQSLQGRIAQKEKENNTLQQSFSKILKEKDTALERKGDIEKELITKNKFLQENVNQLRSEMLKRQEENAKSTNQMYGKAEHELTVMRAEEQRLLTRNTQLENENSKLREKIAEISKEKDKALTKNYRIEAELNNSKMEVQQKMKEIQELQEHIFQREGETKRLQKELSEILKERDSLLKRKDDFELENQRLQESSDKLHAENKIFEEKVSSTGKVLEEVEKQLKSTRTETHRLQEKVTRLETENNQLREDIAEVSKEKDNALTRLSKVAGAKLTHGNAAITDLSDTNRPTKIAEKFSELYDNQWTDAFEELDNTYNNEEETIQALLKILLEAYNFCVQTERNYETRIGQAVFTLADEKTSETRQITGADVPVQKALTDLRLSLGNACCLIVEEMFLARLPSILKKVDISVSPKTKLYARQCASLCWRMRIRDPPVFVRFEFRRGTEFNTDILRRYTKTGGYLDFIVWPALYLHENGPVLSKGVAQPKHTP